MHEIFLKKMFETARQKASHYPGKIIGSLTFSEQFLSQRKMHQKVQSADGKKM